MPLLIVVVIATEGFTVYRIHGVFGSNTEITMRAPASRTTPSRSTPNV